MNSTVKGPRPPKHLSSEAKTIWRTLVAEYEIADGAGLAILQTGLEAFGVMRAAEAAIERDGLSFTDRFGQPRPHPLLPAVRDSRAQWMAAVKALNFNLEPIKAIGRPGGS